MFETEPTPDSATPTDVDVAVVGAGPAGALAALGIARAGLRVALIEKYSVPRAKICGQFYNPRVADVIERVGLRDQLQALGPVPIGEFGLFAGARPARALALRRPGFGLCRSAFDAMLTKAAVVAGAHLFAPYTARCDRAADVGWSIALTGARELTLATRFVVFAEGRGSAAVTRLGLAPPSRGLATMGLQAFFRHDQAPGRVELHVFPWGYAGVSDVAQGVSNFCPVIRRDQRREVLGDGLAEVLIERLLRALVQSSPALRERFGAEPQRVSPVQTSAHVSTAAPAEVAGEDFLLAGDCAGYIEPFTGEGIWRACASGVLAGEMASRIAVAAPGDRADLVAEYRRRRQLALQRVGVWNATLRPLMFSPGLARVVSTAASAAPGVASRLLNLVVR